MKGTTFEKFKVKSAVEGSCRCTRCISVKSDVVGCAGDPVVARRVLADCRDAKETVLRRLCSEVCRCGGECNPDCFAPRTVCKGPFARLLGIRGWWCDGEVIRNAIDCLGAYGHARCWGGPLRGDRRWSFGIALLDCWFSGGNWEPIDKAVY